MARDRQAGLDLGPGGMGALGRRRNRDLRPGGRFRDRNRNRRRHGHGGSGGSRRRRNGRGGGLGSGRRDQSWSGLFSGRRRRSWCRRRRSFFRTPRSFSFSGGPTTYGTNRRRRAVAAAGAEDEASVSAAPIRIFHPTTTIRSPGSTGNETRSCLMVETPIKWMLPEETRPGKARIGASHLPEFLTENA